MPTSRYSQPRSLQTGSRDQQLNLERKFACVAPEAPSMRNRARARKEWRWSGEGPCWRRLRDGLAFRSLVARQAVCG